MDLIEQQQTKQGMNKTQEQVMQEPIQPSIGFPSYPIYHLFLSLSSLFEIELDAKINTTPIYFSFNSLFNICISFTSTCLK